MTMENLYTSLKHSIQKIYKLERWEKYANGNYLVHIFIHTFRASNNRLQSVEAVS